MKRKPCSRPPHEVKFAVGDGAAILLRNTVVYLALRGLGVDQDPFSQFIGLAVVLNQFVIIVEARPLLIDGLSRLVLRIAGSLHDPHELDLRETVDFLPVPIVELLSDLVKDLSELRHQHHQVE